jgi:hypothetical protein
MGDCQNPDLRVQSDRRLKLKFLGSKVTTDAGLLSYRELDEALGLTEMGEELLPDLRLGGNKQHRLVRRMLLPVIERYRHLAIPKFLRGDAAFATPALCRLLEKEGHRYAIRVKAKKSAPALDARGARCYNSRPHQPGSSSGSPQMGNIGFGSSITGTGVYRNTALVGHSPLVRLVDALGAPVGRCPTAGRMPFDAMVFGHPGRRGETLVCLAPQRRLPGRRSESSMRYSVGFPLDFTPALSTALP